MITVKRGDTFKLNAAVTADGAAVNITGWTITSQIRTGGGRLINTLTCAIVSGAAGTYTITESAAGVTATWPLEQLEMDIQYSASGTVISTETVKVDVVKDITRA